MTQQAAAPVDGSADRVVTSGGGSPGRAQQQQQQQQQQQLPGVAVVVNTTSSADLAMELEKERRRVYDLELRVRELVACAEREMQSGALAQQRADAAEEQQARFTEELELERLRAQRLEESFGGLTSVVEQLSQQAEAAALAHSEAAPSSPASGPMGYSGEAGAPPDRSALLDRILSLERQVEEAHRCSAASDSECARLRWELQAMGVERAEFQALQAEKHSKMEQQLSGLFQEKERQAEVLSEREAHMQDLDAERTAWMSRQQALELQVDALAQENKELRTRLGAAETRSEMLAFDKERLGGEVMKAMAAMAAQGASVEPVLPLPALQLTAGADATGAPCFSAARPPRAASEGAQSVSMAQWMQQTDADASLVMGTHSPLA